MQQAGGAAAADFGLVGRRHEMLAVQTSLSRGDRGTLLIGPAGVGKSRLAEEIRTLGEDAGMATATIYATPVAAQLTLGALAGLLPIDAANTDLQPVRLLQLARASLADRAGGRRLLLVVDDAHHLDPIGAHLVADLARGGDAYVVLTVRAGEPVADAITDLWKDRVIERLDLAGLDRSESISVAEHLLGGRVAPETADWLSATSGGNPLFLRELVLGGRDRGSLRRRATGTWVLEGTPVTPRLTDLVEQRLRDLTPPLRRGLDLIALTEPLELELADALIGAEVLEELDRRQLVDLALDGARVHLRLVHPLYAEVVRQGPMTLRRRSDLRSAIDAIRDTGARRRDDASRIATWQLAIGGRVDEGVLLRAALAAQYGNDEPTAERLARLALAQPIADPAVAAELGLCLGTCLARLGRFTESLTALHRARGDARDPAVLARIALRTSFVLSEGHGDGPGGERVIRTAIDELPSGPWTRSLRLQQLLILSDTGRISAAEREAAAIELLPVSDDPADAVLAALGYASVEISLGRTDRAERLAADGLRLHLAVAEVDSTFHPLSQAYNVTLARLVGGRLDEVEEAIRAWFEPAGGRALTSTIVHALRARVHIARGRPIDAVAACEAGWAAVTEQSQPYLVRWFASLHAWALALLARHQEAAELTARVECPGSVDMACTAIDEIVAASEVLWLRGDVGASRSLLDAAEVATTANGHRVALAAVLDQLGHRHRDTAAGHRLAAVVHDMEGPTAAMRRALARAVIDGTPAAWARAAEIAEAGGQLLRSAELYGRAATTARAEGAGRDAVRWSDEAARCLASCPAVVVLDLAGLDAVVPLTEREREIAVLVGSGRTSREVATELFVSVRTVDNHLQRAYTKLGITSRRELADRLGLTTGARSPA